MRVAGRVSCVEISKFQVLDQGGGGQARLDEEEFAGRVCHLEKVLLPRPAVLGAEQLRCELEEGLLRWELWHSLLVLLCGFVAPHTLSGCPPFPACGLVPFRSQSGVEPEAFVAGLRQLPPLQAVCQRGEGEEEGADEEGIATHAREEGTQHTRWCHDTPPCQPPHRPPEHSKLYQGHKFGSASLR